MGICTTLAYQVETLTLSLHNRNHQCLTGRPRVQKYLRFCSPEEFSGIQGFKFIEHSGLDTPFQMSASHSFSIKSLHLTEKIHHNEKFKFLQTYAIFKFGTWLSDLSALWEARDLVYCQGGPLIFLFCLRLVFNQSSLSPSSPEKSVLHRKIYPFHN